MAIGHIKSVQIVDGQVEMVVDTGSGPAVTATLMFPPGIDSQPLPGDAVRYSRNGQEIVVTGVFTESSQSGPGEAVLFSRTSDGVIAATVHMKADGAIEIKPGTGRTAGVGNGTDFVAMSTPLNLVLSTLLTSVAPAGVPIVTPSPGATCPVAAAVLAAMIAAFPPTGTAACGSTNLKAD